jgi:hypothetical protein
MAGASGAAGRYSDPRHPTQQKGQAMRKRLKLLTVAVVLLAAGTTFVLWPRPDRITAANCARIREGMSRAEVEAILGGPPGDYRTVLTEPDGDEPFYTVVRAPPDLDALGRQHDALQRMTEEERLEWKRINQPSPDRWQGDTANIYVTFWPEGAVCPTFSPLRKIEQSRLDNLVWRVKRQWQKWFPE